MIEQMYRETAPIQKAARAASGSPVLKASTTIKFAEVLKLEVVDPQAPNETGTPETEKPASHLLELHRHEMLNRIDFLAIMHGTEVPPDDHGIPLAAQLRTEVRAAQLHRMKDARPASDTRQLDEAPVAIESPGMVTVQTPSSGAILAVRDSAPADVAPSGDAAMEGTEHGLQDEEESEFPNAAVLVEVCSTDDMTDSKFNVSTRESNAATEQIVPGLAAASLVQATATVTPARWILSQLEAPLTAVAREVTIRSETAPMRHLTVNLTPGDLGTISVTLRMQEGKLSISIGASIPETAELLRRDISLLDEMLRLVTGDGAAAVVTVLNRDAEEAAGSISEVGYERESAPNFGESGTGRERSPTGKESGSTQAEERAPVHEEISAGRRSLPGTLVL